jgi:hypothetical protein
MNHSINALRRASPMPFSIPKEHNGWFMWVLLALAGLVVAGVGYSFWSIARVPTPTLDVPTNAEPGPTPNAGTTPAPTAPTAPTPAP